MPRVKNKLQSVAAVEAELLKLVRLHGRTSRVALAQQLKIAPSTVCIYADRLLREKFLLELPKEEGGFGRPPALLALNPQGGRFVGIDFEARNLMAVAVDFAQEPVHQIHLTIRASDSAEQILEKMESAIAEVLADDPRPPLGIGVGAPGVINPVQGTAVRYPPIKGWANVPIGARLRKKFGAPVFLENNIRCMALAELWFGAGRGLKDFVCVGIRSGIAAGVITDGHLLRGARNQAGEIGHWLCPVPTHFKDPAGARQNGKKLWGPSVPMEELASVSAILGMVQRAKSGRAKSSTVPDDDGWEQFLELVRCREPFAQSLIESIAWVHGWAICQLCAVFDPQKIIFAGPLADLGELFLAPVREAAMQWSGVKPKIDIVCSQLGNFNGALGAAALALHQWTPTR